MVATNPLLVASCQLPVEDTPGERMQRELVGLVWTLILAVDALGERLDGIAKRIERAELQLAGKVGRR